MNRERRAGVSPASVGEADGRQGITLALSSNLAKWQMLNSQ